MSTASRSERSRSAGAVGAAGGGAPGDRYMTWGGTIMQAAETTSIGSRRDLMTRHCSYPAPMLHLAGQDSEALAAAAGIPLADARRILGAVVGRQRPLREARNVRREVLDRVEAMASRAGLRVLRDRPNGARPEPGVLGDGRAAPPRAPRQPTAGAGRGLHGPGGAVPQLRRRHRRRVFALRR